MSASALNPPNNCLRQCNGNASALVEPPTATLMLFDSKGDRRIGRLRPPNRSGFTQLPFDVLLEIFGWLHPPDLLHLVRANKRLHDILLDKTSAGAWRNARLNLKGFPEPSIGISELRWAHLAFVQRCHFCWKKKVVAPNFKLQCRICPACAETLLVPQGSLYNSVVDFNDVQEIKLIFSLIPHHDFAKYHRRHMDTYALRASFESVQQSLREYDQETRERFIQVRKAFVEDVSQKAEIGKTWYAASIAARQAEKKDLKFLRQKEIYKKLVAEGHTDGLDDFRDSISFKKHPCVKGSVRLTDKGWQSIRAKMVAFCDELKQAKCVQEHTIAYNQRKHIAVSILRDFKNDPSRMPLTMVYPNLPDFCNFPPVHAVLDLPTDVQVTEEHFQNVIPQIPALCDEWYRSLPGKVVHNALRMVSNCDESTWPVDLACKAFLCRRCSDVPPCTTTSKKKYADLNTTPICVPVFWPEPLTHHCATMIPTSGWAEKWGDDATCLKFMSTQEGREVRRTEWDLALRQSNVLEEVITVIVEMAALDPKSATVADMDAKGVLFGCRKCLADSRERLLLDWRGIARHSFEHHYFDHKKVHKWLYARNGIDDFPKHWRIVDENYHLIRYECVRCRDLPCEALDGWSEIELDTHLRTHGIRRGVENVDYCKMFGMPDEPLLESVEIVEVSDEEVRGLISDSDDGEDSDTSIAASSDDED